MYSKKWLTNLALILVCQAALVTSVFAHGISTQETVGRGGDFTLQSSDGPISLEHYRGSVVLLFFGYTSCPDVCPITLSVLSSAFSKLEAQELERVTALFVSLDPDRDTPEILGKYAGYFHPNIIGVTDRIEVIDQITENYGIAYEKNESAGSPIGYVINHSRDILVIDRQGRLLEERIKPAISAEDIVTYVRRQLDESQ